jgi:hypothetical protein
MTGQRRFKCDFCKKISIYKNVQCLDIVVCPFCKKELLVPEDSEEIINKSNIRIYRPKRPCEKKR